MKQSSASCSASQLKINNGLAIMRNLIKKAVSELSQDHDKELKSTSPKKRKSDSTSETEEVNQVIDVLKKGYIMTKHSNGSSSKSKFVYLSMSEKFLCWKSVDKNDEKRMEVCNISHVAKDGKRFLEKKDSRVKNSDCCLGVVSEDRILVLQAANPLECQLFEEDLQRAIKYCRKMSLNYMYLIE